MAAVAVHVGSRAADEAVTERHWALLDAGERALAARYRTAIDRARFIDRRGARRLLLAAHLNADPQAIRFIEGANGKPALADGTVEFSCSHAGDDWMLAIADVALGCDLARFDPAFRWRDVVDAFFAQRERAALNALPPEEAATTFLEMWARKEALVKALGHGLSFPLDAFVVMEGAGAPYQAGVAGYQAMSFWPSASLCAAIVTRSPTPPLCRIVGQGAAAPAIAPLPVRHQSAQRLRRVLAFANRAQPGTN